MQTSIAKINWESVQCGPALRDSVSVLSQQCSRDAGAFRKLAHLLLKSMAANNSDKSLPRQYAPALVEIKVFFGGCLGVVALGLVDCPELCLAVLG